jgi:hypothetical protein
MKNLGNNDDEVLKVDLSKQNETTQDGEETTHRVNLVQDQTSDSEVSSQDTTDEQAQSEEVLQSEVNEIDEGTEEEENTEGAPEGEQIDVALVVDTGSDDNVDTASESDDEALEEITDEEQEEVNDLSDQLNEAAESGSDLPENVKSLVKFLEETNGTIEDYVKLNRDVDSIPEDQLLIDYLKAEEPGLSDEDYQLILENEYSVETEDEYGDKINDPKAEIKRKRALAKAKKFAQEQKDKYYKLRRAIK